MRVQTYETQTPQVLQIPDNIQKDIEEKGFHLYKWISPEEVKLSIERDFLKTLKYIGLPLGIIAAIFGLITIPLFFVVLIIGIFFIFIYLFLLSLRRSFLLSKGAFVVMTDSSISLGGKIVKLSEVQSLKEEKNHIEKQFEERLFEESQLEKSKKSLSQSVLDQLFGGYHYIFKGSNYVNGRENEKFLLGLIALYTFYAIIMAGVYFVGVLFLWIFGALITKINTWYLLSKGHTVLKINELFGNIDRTSQDIQSEKIELEQLLTQAYENNWQEGLLTKINAGITEINKAAQDAVQDIGILKNTIQHSQYKEMFSFSVYNDWIKKQIRDPLEKILLLLEKNRDILEKTIEQIEKQKVESEKKEHTAALALQQKRLEIQLGEIEKFIPMLERAIEKLQN